MSKNIDRKQTHGNTLAWRDNKPNYCAGLTICLPRWPSCPKMTGRSHRTESDVIWTQNVPQSGMTHRCNALRPQAPRPG